MKYEVFCSIWHFAVYCNALLNSFILCDFYNVVISFGHFYFHSTLELTFALILTLCVNFDLSLFSPVKPTHYLKLNLE